MSRKQYNGKDYPENWPEVYAWLGKEKINDKTPAYAGRCTSHAKRRIRGVAYNGSSLRKLPPMRGEQVDLVERRVCDITEYQGRGYLRPTPSVTYQEQAAINTIVKLKGIFPEKILVLNINAAVKSKPAYGVSDFIKWTEEHNGGYDYYPDWFENILRLVVTKGKDSCISQN